MDLRHPSSSVGLLLRFMSPERDATLVLSGDATSDRRSSLRDTPLVDQRFRAAGTGLEKSRSCSCQTAGVAERVAQQHELL